MPHLRQLPLKSEATFFENIFFIPDRIRFLNDCREASIIPYSDSIKSYAFQNDKEQIVFDWFKPTFYIFLKRVQLYVLIARHSLNRDFAEEES